MEDVCANLLNQYELCFDFTMCMKTNFISFTLLHWGNHCTVVRCCERWKVMSLVKEGPVMV